MPGPARWRDARLVRERKDGRNLYYVLDSEPLALIDGWLELYRGEWGERLMRLKRHVETGSP